MKYSKADLETCREAVIYLERFPARPFPSTHKDASKRILAAMDALKLPDDTPVVAWIDRNLRNLR